MKIITANNTAHKTNGYIGIAGISGSGKSTTAVMLANAMIADKHHELFLGKDKKPDMKYFKVEINEKGKKSLKIVDFSPVSDKVGIIDLEHGRALQSANKILTYRGYGGIRIGAAKIIELNSGVGDMLIKDMIDAMNMLIKEGCEIIIVDSMSIFWDWLKLQQEKLTGGDNTKNMSAWGTIGKYWNQWRDSFMLANDIDKIFTFRAKQSSSIIDDDNASKEIAQGIDFKNKTIEYDLTTLFFLSLADQGKIESTWKDNSEIFLTGDYVSPVQGKLYEEWELGKLPNQYIAMYNLKRLHKIDSQRFDIYREEFYKENDIDMKVKLDKLDELNLKALETYMVNSMK